MDRSYCIYCMEPLADGIQFCAHCQKTQSMESPSHHLKPLSVLQKKYIIGCAIGEGGFGITYIGRDLILDMPIAVKEYYPNGYSNRNHLVSNIVTLTQAKHKSDFTRDMQRFLHEARILAKFSGETGVVGVRDFFQENGTAYIVMEYLNGITLKEYLHRYGPVPSDTLFQMMRPIIQALSGIHMQGLIHRDISPDNIMLLNNGQLKLLDFGAAREVAGDKSLSVMLKPGYAPEEQYRTKGQQGPWTDVYAMCATMYKCITGVTPDESVQRVFDDELKPPSKLGISINPQKEAALMHGMAVKYQDRFQTMEALERALGGENAEDTRTIHISRQNQITEQEMNYQPVPDSGETLSHSEKVFEQKDNSMPTTDEKKEDLTTSTTKANKRSISKKTVWIFLSGIAVLVAGILLCFSLMGERGGGEVDSLDDSLPTERTMFSHCAQALREENIDGSVLEISVDDESLNERFKIYIVTCSVKVKEETETSYVIELQYEYDDGSWVLYSQNIKA